MADRRPRLGFVSEDAISRRIVMDRWMHFVIVLLAAVGVGCANARTAEVERDGSGGTGRTSDGALMTLEGGDDGPIWEGWTPSQDGETHPAGLAERVGAFDYWRVDDRGLIRGVWSKLFPVLQGLQTDTTDRRSRESMSLFLESMEPGDRSPPTRMDVTFLVGDPDQEPLEGVACRLFRELEGGAAPTVTVLLLRRSGDQSSPGEIYVWAAPGFEQPSSVTAKFALAEEGWRRSLGAGLQLEEVDGSVSRGERVRLAAEMLTESIWGRFAGNKYVSSPDVAGAEGGRLPETVSRALGMDVTSRAIDQVYSDTEFPPRANASEL